MKGLSRSLVAVLGAAALSVGFAACGSDDSTPASDTSTPAAGGDQLTLRLGYVTTPQHPYGLSIAKYVEDVAAASGGKITISPLPGANQGNDVALLESVQGGSIEMAAVSTAVWDGKGVNVFQPLQAPFLITNYGLDEAVLSGEIGKGMLDSPAGPAKLGLVGLGLLEGGLRKPVGRDTPLKSPADFAGKKLRAPASKIMTSSLKALGAEPVAMPLGDVASSLQTGKIDGLEANYGLIFTQKFNEGAKFVTADVSLWPFPAAVVINKAQWDKLTPEQQGILKTAGENLAKNSIQGVFVNPPATATNFIDELCKAGMQLAVAGDANRKALGAAAQSAVDELAKDADAGPFLKQIQDAKAAAGPPPDPPPFPASCKTV